jgi:hypothetical protein
MNRADTQPHTVSQMRLHIGADVRGAIGGRDDLEDQFWRQRAYCGKSGRTGTPSRWAARRKPPS